MGFIYEGRVEKSQKTLRMAECKHGPLWSPIPEIRNFYCDETPPIKSDSELIDILASGDGTDWNYEKLSRLRMGFFERDKDKPLSLLVLERKRRKQDKIRQQIEEERRYQKYLKNEKERQERLQSYRNWERDSNLTVNKLNKELQAVRSINQIFTPGFIPFNMEICKSIMEVP